MGGLAADGAVTEGGDDDGNWTSQQTKGGFAMTALLTASQSWSSELCGPLARMRTTSDFNGKKGRDVPFLAGVLLMTALQSSRTDGGWGEPMAVGVNRWRFG